MVKYVLVSCEQNSMTGAPHCCTASILGGKKGWPDRLTSMISQFDKFLKVWYNMSRIENLTAVVAEFQ